MSTIRNVPWEILPPGEGDARLTQIVSRVAATDPRRREAIRMRADFLRSLKPHQWILGLEGFEGYVGAQITTELIVFDNYLYGNAVYIMFRNWELLSQKSRRELLRDFGDEVIRIPHNGNWMEQVLDRIARHRN